MKTDLNDYGEILRSTARSQMENVATQLNHAEARLTTDSRVALEFARNDSTNKLVNAYRETMKKFTW